jgi:hypothetical protein
MKYAVAIVVFATVLASPAFGQSFDPSVGSGNLNAAPYRNNQTAQTLSPYDAHAQVQAPSKRHLRGVQAPRFDGRLIDENMPGRW